MIDSIDRITAFGGLWSKRFSGLPYQLFCKILLLAASNNIFAEPRWLDTKSNILADAFPTIQLREYYKHLPSGKACLL